VNGQADTSTAGPFFHRAVIRRQWVAGIAFVLSAVFFLSRLCVFVSRNSVNVVYWDQWDFMMPLFEEKGLWELFRFRHGPVEQGLGELVIAFSNSVSSWTCESSHSCRQRCSSSRCCSRRG